LALEAQVQARRPLEPPLVVARFEQQPVAIVGRIEAFDWFGGEALEGGPRGRTLQ
jgi:hypothetical protein